MSLFAVNEGLSYEELTLMSMNFKTWPLNLFYGYLIACFSEPCRERNIVFPYSDIRDFNKWISKDDEILVKLMEYWVESQPKAPEEADKKKPLPKAKPGVRR